MEYRTLSADERKQWKELVEGFFTEFEGELGPDALAVLCEVASAALYEDTDERMSELFYRESVIITRWQSHPIFAHYLIRALEHFVAKGSGAACCDLGSFYYSGEGVPQSYERAAELYRLGADRGSDQAAVNLGYIYCYGRIDGNPDYVRAYECFSRGAFMADNAEAYWKLADLYANGLGVAQDKRMAWVLYLRAHKQAAGTNESARPAHHLADFLMSGIDGFLEPDPDSALRLYVEAEVGYRRLIEGGLTYYGGALEQAIEGQGLARAASIELHRPRNWDNGM